MLDSINKGPNLTRNDFKALLTCFLTVASERPNCMAISLWERW